MQPDIMRCHFLSGMGIMHNAPEKSHKIEFWNWKSLQLTGIECVPVLCQVIILLQKKNEIDRDTGSFV